MARFTQLLRGTRARRTVEFPQQPKQSAPGEGQEAQPPEEPVLVDVRVLNGVEESECLAKAHKAAKEKGIDDPKPGQPLFDLELMVQTLARAYVDHDSPEQNPVPFFDSPEQVHQELDRETITYLYQLQEHWQSECSPQARKMSLDHMLAWVAEFAGSEDPLVPFSKLQPATAVSYLHSLAKLLLSSHQPSSPLGSTSKENGTAVSKKRTSKAKSAKVGKAKRGRVR